MKKVMLKFVVLLFLLTLSCEAENSGNQNKSNIQKNSTKAQVTFIELGSVNCIPCKMMQPIMKAIEKKYSSQVKVVFYDDWTKEQQRYAEVYKIKLIPTQIFLDENGKEFHRHEGFYPEAEIDKILIAKGLKLIK